MTQHFCLFLGLLFGFVTFATNPLYADTKKPSKKRLKTFKKRTSLARARKATRRRKVLVLGTRRIKGKMHLPRAYYVFSRQRLRHDFTRRRHENLIKKVILVVKKKPF